jgi:hypothetical protein
MNVMAGCDFFTVEVLLARAGIHLESRRVSVARITRHPDQAWMEQIAPSATQAPEDIFMHVVMFCTITTQSSAERWVRWVKQECLSKVILAGAGPLSRAIKGKTAGCSSRMKTKLVGRSI